MTGFWYLVSFGRGHPKDTRYTFRLVGFVGTQKLSTKVINQKVSWPKGYTAWQHFSSVQCSYSRKSSLLRNPQCAVRVLGMQYFNAPRPRGPALLD